MNEEIISLIRDLVRVPTIYSKGGKEIVKIIQNYLDKQGADYEMDIIQKEDGIQHYIFKCGNEPKKALNAHYDVVPVKDQKWSTKPFEGEIKDNKLYGRGASDDKGALAAFIDAFARFSLNISRKGLENEKGAVLMVPGDEEYDDVGTKYLLEHPYSKDIKEAIVGEPVSTEKFGDTLLVGRRGVFTIKIILEGKSAHSSTPDEALNPIDGFIKYLKQMKTYKFNDDPSMLPTSFAPVNIESTSGTTNVTPSKGELMIDIRYNLRADMKKFLEYSQKFFSALNFKSDIRVIQHFTPYLTKDQAIINKVEDILKSITNISPRKSTEGGASDARYFYQNNIPVVEIGPTIHNIHSSDESLELSDLPLISEVAYRFLMSD